MNPIDMPLVLLNMKHWMMELWFMTLYNICKFDMRFIHQYYKQQDVKMGTKIYPIF